MALKTRGFLSNEQLARHFNEHAADFGVSNTDEYERLADAFLAGTRPVSVYECRRKKGDIIRYDPSTEAYGVLDSSRIIRTYFKPVPCSSVAVSVLAAVSLAGRCHPHANNFQYFKRECRRW